VGRRTHAPTRTLAPIKEGRKSANGPELAGI